VTLETSIPSLFRDQNATQSISSSSTESRIAESDAFLARVESRRSSISDSLNSDQKAHLGQFFTPCRAANLITNLVSLPQHGKLRILDPGAGIGSLTAAIVAKVVCENPDLELEIMAVEVDSRLLCHLERTLEECKSFAASNGLALSTVAVNQDVVEMATGWKRELFNQFDVVLMNPPYRKLASRSIERRSLSALGIDSPNLYSTFLAIGALALAPGGQLIAITPRSFMNGPYFGAFRRFFLSEVTLDHIHVFESRSTVFADSGVLQENVIFSAKRWNSSGKVKLSVSRGHTDDALSREVPYDEIVRPNDRHQFIHIPTNQVDTDISEVFASLPSTILETGIQVSTGKVVDFRSREYLLSELRDVYVPLIYPGNLREGQVVWPKSIRKPQGLALNEATTKLVLPNERFVLVKRFSSKEEKRRVVAAVYEPEQEGRSGVGFENHLNVFHENGRGLSQDVARGLCLWLNSSIVDRLFRTFSGHTQVNATDLRSMRYPSREQLGQLGSSILDKCPDQASIDALVNAHVFTGHPFE
jgi:adenine-specific DNA-methyltransferase